MFDLVGLAKFFYSLWPFFKEHVLKNRKVMKHFQYSTQELSLAAVHIVILVMLANLYFSIIQIVVTNRDLESGLFDERRKTSLLESSLVEKDRMILSIKETLKRAEDERDFLRTLLRTGEPANDIKPPTDQ